MNQKFNLTVEIKKGNLITTTFTMQMEGKTPAHARDNARAYCKELYPNKDCIIKTTKLAK